MGEKSRRSKIGIPYRQNIIAASIHVITRLKITLSKIDFFLALGKGNLIGLAFCRWVIMAPHQIKFHTFKYLLLLISNTTRQSSYFILYRDIKYQPSNKINKKSQIVRHSLKFLSTKIKDWQNKHTGAKQVVKTGNLMLEFIHFTNIMMTLFVVQGELLFWGGSH